MSAAADVRPALMGHLKDLRLPTVRECYEETAQQAEREALSYEQYLLEVISRECDQRRKSKVQRLLKDSALPLEKSLQNFNLKRLPAKAARQLRTLQEGSFLDRKENVLVFGNPGSGKSHLLTALAQELVVTRERKMHFTKCALLMQDLLAAKRDLRLSREIKRLGRYEGLIIDDLGYLQQSRDDMEVVFTLLAERYERGSVLMTSNLAFSKWEAILRDHRTEHHELPGGGSQEESTGGKSGRGRVRRNSGLGRKPTGKESCGNAGAVESLESQRQAFHPFHEPLGNPAERRRDSHIPTAPATTAGGKVENQNQVSHFPTATTSQIEKRKAFSHGERSAPPKHRRVIVVDREK
jgi:DNA replication protein DnaC